MINTELGKFGGGKKYPLLLEGGKLTNVNLEARKFVAEKDSNPYSSAEAIIVKSLPQRLIGNFYMKFNKPGRPTKLFPNEAEAVIWLKRFL
jgi:hypothetical protein